MIVRQWFAAAAMVGGGVALAAEPAPPQTGTGPVAPAAVAKPLYTFGTLRAMPADAAKQRAAGWLKSVGQFDQTKFDAIWANESRSAFDRTVDSLTLGLPAAAGVLAESRAADAPAPTAVPSVLKDDKLDPFVRGNLATAFAKAIGTRRVYEEALEAMKGVQPDALVEPASFYFYKAVAEHALMLREPALTSIVKLLDDVADAPDRYKMVATLMFFDVQNWPKDEKDLSNIGRLMDNSGRRLDLARAGTKTQDIQKKIVFRLDEKIKELENKQKGQGQCNGGQCPSGGTPGNGSGQGSTPMQDSMGGTNGGEGKVDEKKLRQYAEVWGKLPPEQRAKAVQEITRDLPAKYKPMIEEYFKSLNRVNGFEK